MNKYTLVTGGAGYIGSHFLDLFLQQYDNVLILDNLEHGFLEAVDEIRKRHPKKQIIFEKVDLRDSHKLGITLEKYSISAVVHFAALCVVSESIISPDLYFDNNVIGSINLLNTMAKLKIEKIIFSSSVAVYGQGQYFPVDEKHPLEPIEPYGFSKYVVEKMLPWYERCYGIKYVIFHYSNVCGASPDGQLGFSSRYKQNKLIQDAVKAVVGNYPLHLQYTRVNTFDGSPIRDYVDVLDIANANLKALEYLKHNEKSDVFNLGTGKGYSVKQIISKIETVLKVKISFEREPRREGEPAKVYASYSKAKRLLGWQPATPLEDSICNLANWYRTHPKGYSR